MLNLAPTPTQDFRTGYNVQFGVVDIEDKVEFDRASVARAYLCSWFPLDVISGIPFMAIELVLGACGSGGDGAASSLKSMKILRLLRFAKLGRLLKIGKILSSLDRDTLDKVEDIMQDGRTRTIILLTALTFKMGFLCHILTCTWVYIGRLGDAQGDYNWLAYESCSDLDEEGEIKCDWGPFTKEDTTGGEHVGTIYLSAYYFSLATITSVGYGDIHPRNDNERMFGKVPRNSYPCLEGCRLLSESISGGICLSHSHTMPARSFALNSECAHVRQRGDPRPHHCQPHLRRDEHGHGCTQDSGAARRGEQLRRKAEAPG